MKRILLILITLPILLVGCAKDNSTTDERGGDGTINFLPKSYADNITQYDWALNEQVGMFMKRNGVVLNHADTKGAIYQYLPIGLNSGELKGIDVLNILGIPKYSVNFVSYKPYRASLVTDGYKFSVDVNTYTTYKDIDLVYSNNGDVYGRLVGETDVELKYYHMMSKMLLRFKSTDPTKLTEAALPKGDIKIKGMPTKVTFNMITEVYEALSGETIDIAKFNEVTTTPNDPTVRVFEVIVPPQQVAWTTSVRSVEYKSGGVTEIKNMHWNTLLKQGMVHSFDIDLDVNYDVIIDDPLVTPWGLGSIYELERSDDITGYFEDAVFRKWVQDKFCEGRSVIYAEDLAEVKTIDIKKSELPGLKTIATLAGIEFMPKLEKLDVSNSEAVLPADLGFYIGHINVSRNPALTYLDCHKNRLPSLDVSKNLALTYLDCSYNALPSLDVSNNTALITLNCGGNNRFNTNLDVSKNVALTRLTCIATPLPSLDVGSNTELTYLDCSFAQLPSLDVSKNVALTSLTCNNNNLTSINLTGAVALTNLHCDYNQLPSLDVSKNLALTYLSCLSNRLPSLDVSENLVLTTLNCNENQLPSLDVSKNLELTYLSCLSNQLTSLDISKNLALTYLHCYDNLLTELDVSKNLAFTELNCFGNLLTSLDVSNNINLTKLRCHINLFTTLDFSSNLALTSLDCGRNPLTSLDLSALDITKFVRISFNETPGNGTTTGSLNPASFEVKLPVGSSVTNPVPGVFPISGWEFTWTYRFEDVPMGQEFTVKTKYTVAP